MLYERGLIGPTDGNLSARVGDGRLLCTPSGVHKGALREGDLVLLDLDGRVIRGGRASTELKLHLALYAQRPGLACVVHAHPPSAVGLTVAGWGLDPPVVPEILFAMGRVPTVPYASPTTSDVPDAVAAVVAAGCEAFMLARHGSVVMCDDPMTGVLRTEIIEHTAKITIAARSAGSATPLPEDEIRRLLALAGR
ncbi:MAG: class II aldolase/adducin family protein [Deltaproteobacteria bacterium]|nr:class II aldolase/adducin family protein [Deltaproteobacteria bacterium]